MERGLNFANPGKITWPKRKLAALLAVVLTAAAVTAPMASAGISTIKAHVVNLHDNRGQVICTLFAPSDKFPEHGRKGMTIAVPIQNQQATCNFANIQYGDYAIVAFHDENHDGKFNQDWLGMPREGFGFSDNPGLLRKPTFNDARFNVAQSLVDITIKLHYWF
jgi:uncharacterized protein (DUF2141 family)